MNKFFNTITENITLQSSPIQTWMIAHLRAAIFALGSLYRTPLSSFMTMVVMAVAIALPLFLFIALQNVHQLSDDWPNFNQISVFLHQNSTEKTIDTLQSTLQKNPSIDSVQYISKTAALEHLQQHSGLSDPLQGLEKNPLPDAFLITMNANLPPDHLTQLTDMLKQHPAVEWVQADIAWLKRFHAAIALGQEVIMVIGLLLALGILLIIANTIRLIILSRKQEIEITKLVGGTNRFIRRPFLYTGFWFGLGSGILSCLIVTMVILTLKGSTQNLADLYLSEFYLSGLTLHTALSVIVFTIVIGVGGAWVSLWRHLSDIEPR